VLCLYTRIYVIFAKIYLYRTSYLIYGQEIFTQTSAKDVFLIWLGIHKSISPELKTAKNVFMKNREGAPEAPLWAAEA